MDLYLVINYYIKNNKKVIQWKLILMQNKLNINTIIFLKVEVILTYLAKNLN